jgi:hypothetical protein
MNDYTATCGAQSPCMEPARGKPRNREASEWAAAESDNLLRVSERRILVTGTY